MQMILFDAYVRYVVRQGFLTSTQTPAMAILIKNGTDERLVTHHLYVLWRKQSSDWEVFGTMNHRLDTMVCFSSLGKTGASYAFVNCSLSIPALTRLPV